jgi:hypothetical protein
MTVDIGTLLLQACTVNEWLAADVHRCVFTPVTGLIGEGVFGLLVGSVLYLALYIAGNGDMTVPTVVCILVATLAFPILPNQFNPIAWSVLLVGAAAAVLQVLQRYVLDPSTSI